MESQIDTILRLLTNKEQGLTLAASAHGVALRRALASEADGVRHAIEIVKQVKRAAAH